MAMVKVTTLAPDQMKEALKPGSSFFKDSGIDPNNPGEYAPLLENMRKLAAGEITSFEVDMATLRKLGLAVDRGWMSVTVKDSKGKEVTLDSAEFCAWQGTVKGSEKTSAPELPVDEWAKRENITLKDRGQDYKAGDQHVRIENPSGSKRAVRGGRTITEPFYLNYGDEEILGPDAKPILVGRDGQLDVFIPDAVLNDIKRGKPYNGPVVIKSRIEDGNRSDPKVFYLKDPKEAIIGESKSFGGEKIKVSEHRGVKFEPPIELPKSFVDYNESDGAKYTVLSGSQYRAWKHAIAENPKLADVPLEKWISDTFGSKENFDKAFARYGDGALTREQYDAVMRDVQKPAAQPGTQTTPPAPTQASEVPDDIKAIMKARGLEATPENIALTERWARVSIEGKKDEHIDGVLTSKEMDMIRARAREAGIKFNPASYAEAPPPTPAGGPPTQEKGLG